jgi:hypothetical protein
VDGFWRFGRERFCWGRGRRNDEQRPTFRRVSPTSHVAEYRGSLPATLYAEHHLWCIRIPTQVQAELLSQGFTGLGEGRIPTHSIYCVVRLGQAQPKPRLCFNLYLSLDRGVGRSATVSRLYADSIAERVTTQIAQAMRQSPDRVFLIRCLNALEFPWCMVPDHFDEYWLIELGVRYRSVLKNQQQV